jgi:DNA repair exonuclease SbcCD ATPase subunit/DNA repair exonuclease SbcCD nuclease subunit
MVRLAHFGDTHIKNLKYHYEYRKVFEQAYEMLREQKVDYIIHCGDLAHTKTQLSPEYFELATEFLKNLADIAPTHIILGNHDGNLRNSSRQDAITPIVDALEHPDLHLHKFAGEVKLDHNVTLNVLSVFDETNWTDPTDTDRINIALYHGAVNNSRTDLGWIMDHGDHDVAVFDKFDYAFLGDIHKTNQCLNETGTIRYCGSTIQQNHGETNDKGFLVWDIEDKTNYEVNHHILKNPKPFTTIELTPKGNMPRNLDVQQGCRLRIITHHKVSLDKIRRVMDTAKSKFKPESLSFVNKAGLKRSSVDVDDLGSTENLRDPAVQERLIREYLKEYEPDTKTLERVFQLNSRYDARVNGEDASHRNVKWSLKNMQFDNLFNYGEGNSVNFEKLNGVVGIFGKNYSGKSSIIDSMLYTVYNSISKNNRKNLNIVNQTKPAGCGRVEIDIAGKTYIIERKSEKYTKKLHGEETEEAKTDVEFKMIDPATDEEVSLNSLDRNGTDKAIRKIFGSLDDFLLTSMSSQMGAMTFINEGSTKRKEILAKFLDLDQFDKKFKLAKSDSVDTRALLRKLEDNTFDEDITQLVGQMSDNEKAKKKQERKCGKLTTELETTAERIKEIDGLFASAPVELINIRKETTRLAKAEQEKTDCELRVSGAQTKKEILLAKLSKINDFLGEFDNEGLEAQIAEVLDIKEQVRDLETKLKIENRNKETYEKRVELLKEVPCGPEFSDCKFIKDAYKSKTKLTEVRIAILDLEVDKRQCDERLSEMNVDSLRSQKEKHDKLIEKQRDLSNEATGLDLLVEKTNNQINALTNEIKDINDRTQTYEDNKEAIENREELIEEQTTLSDQKILLENELSICEAKIMDFIKQHGGIEQQIANLEEKKQELEELRTEYSAYDLFMRCTHSNGISYDVVKRMLPLINDEVSTVLANVTDFDIFFEAERNKLDIFIKHPKYEARPLEMASGAEKTLAAIAIRIALTNVSTLPKSDIMIMDEPGTALDAENLEGFMRVMEMIKGYYKTVLLITHLDSLKDIADMTIDIERQDGYAFVSQ